jgi:hypothetical protein
MASLLRDDQKSLSILLHSLLVDKLQIQKSVASETVGQIIGVSERTVREWRSVFTENDGCFPDSLQGKYVREDVLWLNKELMTRHRVMARECIRQRSAQPHYHDVPPLGQQLSPAVIRFA